MTPNLSTVRFARYAANFIPRNAPVSRTVDDVNTHAGFWRPQPDFRIPERLSPGFGPFPDEELEAMYRDQVVTFVDYQTRLALRAISAEPIGRPRDDLLRAAGRFRSSVHADRSASAHRSANAASIGIPAPGATGTGSAKVSRYASIWRSRIRRRIVACSECSMRSASTSTASR